MSTIYDVNETMHRLGVKLYPNHLEGGEGTYIVRIANEASATIEDVCAAMVKRGGYTGSYDELVRAVEHFFKEMMYQIANGFSVNTGFFKLYPAVSFPSKKEEGGPDHHITLRLLPLKPLRRLLNSIEVIVEGRTGTPAWISEFMDQETGTANTLGTPGNIFAIHGRRIKIAGDDPDCGLYFVPLDDPGKAVKAARIVENTASKITGITPSTGCPENRIEIRTQYSGATNTPLKAIRVIPSPFVLKEG